MTIDLRDQRARVYAYYDADQDSTGYPNPKYRILPSPDPDMAWWARVEEPGGHETTVGELAERQSPAIIGFSDEVVVPLQSVILLLLPDGTPGPLYRTASVNPRRIVREIAVQAVFADQSRYTLVD